MGNCGRARRVEQVRRSRRGFGPRQICLMFLHSRLDSIEIGNQPGNSILTQGGNIDPRDQVKVTLASRSESGARSLVHVAGGLARLGLHSDTNKDEEKRKNAHESGESHRCAAFGFNELAGKITILILPASW